MRIFYPTPAERLPNYQICNLPCEASARKTGTGHAPKGKKCFCVIRRHAAMCSTYSQRARHVEYLSRGWSERGRTAGAERTIATFYWYHFIKLGIWQSRDYGEFVIIWQQIFGLAHHLEGENGIFC
ncbi:hypothetical protein SS50377_21444 [Spironucleus salmonicida]|uniref:Uncharacterized protein n=1 Tax=Spironucleus salmonicida TaxID=348837 RepID=A0A9P8LX88_9EUKA|nr:hypothetical protein SS50377_21444 [Spironucleus salmonicida]